MKAICIAHAMDIVPGGSSTNAKSPLRLYPPDTPAFAVSAKGCHFSDEHGRVWLDCDMALGTVVWGHCRPEIDEAIRQQLLSGVLFSVPAALEIEVAEKIKNRLWAFESLRFFKSGSDAVSAAIRIARAHNRRRLVVCGSYHGWHDWAAYHHYECGTELGIPPEVGSSVHWLPEESYIAFSQIIKDEPPAALVVCPEHWDIADLRLLRASCNKRGIVLVFDEVKAGLRYGKCGVFGATGVVPDLLCLSKGLANGLPLGVLAGSRELMHHCIDAHITGTHAGECLSLAAARASELLLSGTDAWPPWEGGARAIMTQCSEAITKCSLMGRLTVDGYPGCFRIGTPGVPVHADPFREHFVRRLARVGIFSSGYILLSAAHGPDDHTAVAQVVTQAIYEWADVSS